MPMAATIKAGDERHDCPQAGPCDEDKAMVQLRQERENENKDEDDCKRQCLAFIQPAFFFLSFSDTLRCG